MPKSIKIILILAIIIVVGGVSFVLFLFTKRAGNNEQNQNIVINTNQPVTKEDIQKYIDDILADKSIDINNWPTFTNTEYHWSIKYHPDGKWQPDSMIHTSETAPSPSYWLEGSLALSVTVYKNEDDLSLIEFAKNYTRSENHKNLKMIDINDFKSIIDSTDGLRFFILSPDSSKVADIVPGPINISPLKEQLIKSVSTFNFLENYEN